MNIYKLIKIGVVAMFITLFGAVGGAQAAQSTTFQLFDDFQPATGDIAGSTSFSLDNAQMTFNSLPIASTNFQIVTAPPAAESSSSSVESSSSSDAGGGGGGGGRRGRGGGDGDGDGDGDGEGDTGEDQPPKVIVDTEDQEDPETPDYDEIRVTSPFGGLLTAKPAAPQERLRGAAPTKKRSLREIVIEPDPEFTIETVRLAAPIQPVSEWTPTSIVGATSSIFLIMLIMLLIIYKAGKRAAFAIGFDMSSKK